MTRTSRLSSDPRLSYSVDGDDDAEARSRRANRRRLIVFVSTFVGLAFVGLVWVFSRPPIYEATARLNFVPMNGQSPDDAAPGAKPYTLRDEVQYLTSRTLLAKVWDDLKDLSATPRRAEGPTTRRPGCRRC